MSLSSDQELISDYLAGQPEALTSLVNRHLPAIYNFIFRLSRDEQVATDLAQDVFIKVWKKIDSFDPDQNFKTWLFTIARRTVIDH